MKNLKPPAARGARLALALLALAGSLGCDESGTIPRIENEVVLGRRVLAYRQLVVAGRDQQGRHGSSRSRT